jgi:hypothetical protein
VISPAKRILIAVALAAVPLATTIGAHPALAGKPSPSGGTGLTLASTSVSQYAPNNCYHEDSMNKRTWTGSLGPGATYTVPLYYCVPSVDGVGPGGATLFTAVSASAALALTITAPDGTVYTAHNLGTTNGVANAAQCFGLVPGVSNTIEPSTWTVTLSNPTASTVKSVTFQANVEQEWEFMWPQFGCPRQDWNYTPATVVSPAAGSTVSGAASFTAVASTRIPSYDRMEFYVDGTLVGSIDTTSYFGTTGPCAGLFPSQCPITFSWNTKGYRNGSAHTLTVKDYSSAGDSTTSDPVRVTVQN